MLKSLCKFIAAAVLVFACAELSAQPAKFDEKAVGEFYRGKTIRVIIGSGAGGTYDIYSRLLAKHMPRFIPGTPTLLVVPRPGAGGLIAANAVYNSEPKDGTVIGSFGETFVLRQAIGAPGIQFDSAKFQWLGAAINAPLACVARNDSAISTFQDAVDGKPFTVGTMAPGSTIYDTPAVLNAAFNIQMKLVRGFEGVAAIVNATESKEVEGYCASWLAMLTTGRHLQLIEGGVIKPILIMGDKTPDHPLLKRVPAAETLAKNEEARQLLRTMHAPSQITNPYVVHPEVPKDRVEALRRAFTATFKDPEFLSDAKKTKIEFSPSSGERTTQVVQSILSTPAAVLARMKKVLVE
ncbi:MAG TPA: tripartite tricarboxylate transporter substrate-binding protein [Candidatus Binatia bacterium]|nr:tripartite tricarboxylate transporter substrate-binding protein [Candidatus Binatia bacterium]